MSPLMISALNKGEEVIRFLVSSLDLMAISRSCALLHTNGYTYLDGALGVLSCPTW